MTSLLEAFPWLSNTSLLFIQFISGLSQAAVILMVTLGFSIIFGVARVVNLAHGAFYMLGAYLMATFLEKGEGGHWYIISLVGSACCVAAISGLIEFFLLRKVYKMGPHVQIMMTFGVALCIGTIARFVWGTDFRMVQRPEFLSGSFEIFEIDFPHFNLVLIGFIPIFISFISFALSRTRWGLQVRAISFDREMAEASGVNVGRISTQVFVFSGAFAGLAGGLAASMFAVELNMANNINLISFVVVVIGGLGHLYGTAVASMIVGVLQSLGVLIVPALSGALVYILMALVLIVRPMGIFGRSEGRTEEEGIGS
jgi:branched-chain amino acid transport system permease protein